MKFFKVLCFTLMFSLLTACGSDTTDKNDETDTLSEHNVNETESEADDTDNKEAAQDEDSQTNGIYKIGDKIQAGNLTYTICGSRTSSGSDFFKPEEGNQFLYVDVLIENASDSEESISSLLMFQLVDLDGRNYDISLADDAVGSVDGTIFPGKRMRGEIVFEVPADLTSYELEILPSLLESGTIIVGFNVNETVEPELVDLSAYETQAANVGNTITLGDLAFTLNKIRTTNGDDFLQPEEGNQYVLAELTILNNGSEEANISSLLMFSLIDGSGSGVEYDIALTSTNGSLDGSVAPSRKMTGEVAFEASKDITDFELHVTDLFEQSYFEFTLE